jgi:hypothetical protein
MQKNFIEAVFEGDYHAVRGYIEGFIAAGGKDLSCVICSDAGIEAETLSEHIREWISLGTRLHHVILEEELLNGIKAALGASGNRGLLNSSSIRSCKTVRSTYFNFRFSAYGRKYADEIKELIARLPDGVTLADYNPVETIDEECKGVELYTPCHDYVFQGEGVISGPLDLVIPLRATFEAHPLIEAEKVRLEI